MKKRKNTRKKNYYWKREKFFIEIVDTITMVVAEKKLTNETGERANNLKSKFILYLDISWCEKYWDLVVELLDNKDNGNYRARETTNNFYEELKSALFEQRNTL